MSNLARAGKRINVTWRSENNGFHNQTLQTQETIPRALEMPGLSLREIITQTGYSA